MRKLCRQAAPSAPLLARDCAVRIGSKDLAQATRCRAAYEQPHRNHALGSEVVLSLDVRGWLVGTRNGTEDVLGTYKLASRVATLLPLAGLWKSEVMELSLSVGVPGEILDSSRRADPGCGRPQAMADIPFATVDRFLQVRLGERAASELQSIAPATIEYLDSVYRRNRFEHALPLSAPTSAPGDGL